MPRPSGNTKRKILESAIRSIASRGIEHTNAQIVADDLGISQTAVFYHFPKQGLLFDSLLDLIVEKNRSAPQEKLKDSVVAVEKLRAYFWRNLDWARKNPDHVVVLLSSMARCSHSSELRRKINAVYRVGEDTIYGFIAEGIAERQFRSTIAPRSAARVLHKSLMGLVIAGFYEAKKKNARADLASLMELVGSLLKLG